MLISTKKIPQYIKLYLCIAIILLIFLTLLINNQGSTYTYILLLVSHICLFIYLQYKQKNKIQIIKIPSLNDYQNYNKRPVKLASFQAQAQSILRQINMENNTKINQMKYYSPYSYSPKHPLSLTDITNSNNQFQQDTNIFGTYNIQTWRQQFRLALQQFKKNLTTPIPNKKQYESILIKLNLNIDKLSQTQDLVQNFLKDRSIQYCTYTIKIVNQINKLLLKHFGLSLTKIQSINTKQISMQQFYRLLDYYINNQTLPSIYKNMTIITPNQGLNLGSIDLNLGKYTLNMLDNDMIQLVKYSKILQPMLMFPQQRFNSSLLVYLLRMEFCNQKIQINAQIGGKYGQVVDSSNIFNNIFLSNNNNYIHIFMVQVDYWISLQSMPQFRTKNCKYICIIFLLILIKRQSYIGHPILRTLKKYMK